MIWSTFLGWNLQDLQKDLWFLNGIILFNYLRTLGFLPVSLLMFHGSKLKLTTHDGELLQDASQCRSLIGHLLYFTLSRPNITFVIHKLSQFLSEPRIPHLEAVRYLLLYFKSKPGQCLFFSSSSSLQLSPLQMLIRHHVWFKKVYHWFLHISWRLFDFLERKEANHHLSFFCWSSYHVLAVTTSEIVNLQQLLYDFGITCFTPTLLFCDNQAAIHIASNPILHKRTKHFEIDCHFVHDKVNDSFIKLLLTCSQH